MIEHKDLFIHNGISMDSDEENKTRLLKRDLSLSSQISFFPPSHNYPYFDTFLPTTSISNEFKREI